MLAGGLLIGGMATMVLTSPRPNVEGMVERAEQHLEASRHSEALAVFNDRVRPLLDESYITADTRQRFHAGRARAIAMGIRTLDVEALANHERIVNEYAKAEQAGLELPGDDAVRLIRSQIRLGRFDAAAARIELLTDELAESRVTLRQALIESAFTTAGAEAFADEQLLLLSEDPALTVDGRAWVVARQSERRLADGFVEEAIARLLRVMPRVASSASRRAPRRVVLMLLGAAYAQSDAFA
jgi:hypothetical protein